MTTHYRSETNENATIILVTSKSAIPGLPLDEADRNKFLELLEKFTLGYFVELIDFVILGNHFHLVLRLLEEEGAAATDEEILARHKLMWGQSAVAPNSGYVNGVKVPDKDTTGATRLRKRLTDPGCFMQVVKQHFTLYYNKKHNRKGCFWDGRYHSVPLYGDLSQVTGVVYNETNPVKAGIVTDPEKYKWCGEGLRKLKPELWAKLIRPLEISYQFVEEYLPHAEREKEYEVSLEELMGTQKGRLDYLRTYINRVLHGVDAIDGSDVDPRIIASINSIDRQLNIQKFNKEGARNLTRGVAVGPYDVIRAIQEKTKREHKTPRPLMEGGVLYATRKYK